MQTSDRFEICWPYVLAQECPHPALWSNGANFSNDAHDPGGETMCGVTQREYTRFRNARGLTSQDVRKITEDEGRYIYFNSYWLPKCPSLLDGFDLCFFDPNVNEGEHQSTKILQYVLGCTIDGEWGPVTQFAFNAFRGTITELINQFTARRKAVYEEMPGFKYFGTDWLRRADEIAKAAIGMTTA
ncbi:MAG: glycosyl hydrolase 108 family protein [Burkholderiales bacterium]